MDNITCNIEKDTYDFMLKNVNLLNKEISDSDLLNYFIDKTCTEIIIKTNRNKFPDALKFLVIDLVDEAIGLYTSTKQDAEKNQVVQSMSETGRSITYGTSDDWKTKYKLLLEKQMEDHKTMINRYKLLYKVGCPYEKS